MKKILLTCVWMLIRFLCRIKGLRCQRPYLFLAGEGLGCQRQTR
ncbi:MAG: hypothetical protein WC340_03875 [Kiritimatiellia bacterium]